MASDNLLEYRIRINREGVAELASDLGKVQASSDGLTSASAGAGSALDKMQGAAKGAGAGVSAAAGGMKQLDDAAKTTGAEVEKSTGIIARMGQAWKTTVGQFALGNMVSDLFSSIANRLGDMAREFVRANVEMDGMRRALTAIYKDGAVAESQIAFLRKTANEAGVSYSALTDSFKSFTASATAANIPLAVQNDLFASVAKAGATLGLSGDAVSRALLALSQMASKGVVSMEELRGQLGESLPGALSLAAKGLGLTEAELIKLVESGGLAARDLFPALAQSLKGMSGENDGAAASWDRLKSAITQVFTSIGDAGGMSVLTFAVKALALALSLVLVPLVALINGLMSFGQMVLATGNIIAILTDRTTSWAQKKQAMRTEVDALTEALRANVTRVQEVNDAFGAVAGSTDQAAAATGRATAAAGQSSQAAAALSSAWTATGFAMREAEANAARLAANAEKNAQAVKLEGEALVALARIRGEANALADAEAQAAQRNAQALAAVAAERAKALEITQAELMAKRNLIAGNAEEQKAREKDIKDLGEKVEKLKAEATASQEAANAARNGALAAQAAADARRDHSTQITALVKELERAKAALQDVERLSLNDKKTAEDVRDAKERLTLAQSRLNDAYADNVAKMQAYVSATQSDAQTTRTMLQAQLEVARVEEARARRLGDEYGVRQALIKQKEIELQISAAEVEASKLVAIAKIAETNARREQLLAVGQLTEAKRIELDATIRAAEAQIKLSEAQGEGVKLQKELLQQLRSGVISLDDYTRATGGAAQASHSLSNAGGALRGSLGSAAESARFAGDSFTVMGDRAADAMAKIQRLEAAGQSLAAAQARWEAAVSKSSITNRPASENQYAWTRLSIIDYLKQAGLEEAIAERVSAEFVNANGEVDYINNGGQIKWGGRNSTMSSALQKVVEYYKFGDGRREVDANQKEPTSSSATEKPAATGSSAGAGTSSSGGSGMTTGATYVSHITIDGVSQPPLRFADAQSQQTGESILRDIARARSSAAR